MKLLHKELLHGIFGSSSIPSLHRIIADVKPSTGDAGLLEAILEVEVLDLFF